jgi:hypothetical protein
MKIKKSTLESLVVLNRKVINTYIILFRTGFLISIILLLDHCEGKDKYYRPNLPEKLCCIGIIDADDTSDYNTIPAPFDNRTSARFISFEKSYQQEYSNEVNDSLREFSFSISSDLSELFYFKSDSSIKNLFGFKIPPNINFRSGQTFYLIAHEQNVIDISSKIKVPAYPSIPVLNSIIKEKIKLSKPSPCVGLTTAKSAVINFTFRNIDEGEMFYAILLEGDGSNVSSTVPIQKSQLEFSIRDSNTPGFFAILSGYTMYQWTCQTITNLTKVPVFAYFIEGNKIPIDKCIIKISTQFADDRAPFDILRSLRIRLLSIPKELFLFEKSLYTYNLNKNDPFSEPVYLNGNIVGGNGVFAICRSAELKINFSPWF